MYEKTLYAGWGDVDFNAHMKNTAFLDKSADVRMMFFSQNGFPMIEFYRLSLGPVVMKDEVEYLSEIGLLEETKVTLSLPGLSEDGSRFLMRNEFYRADGKLAARVTSAGGWLDLKGRRLIVPPFGVAAGFADAPENNRLPIPAEQREIGIVVSEWWQVDIAVT